ncbi:hypothetical protein [Acinetobacter ursingii]|uniref:hypothetical protein n=1 Tax=Acinetobacter ursingii TaxID=108980 RepID=UPI0035562F37
MHIKTILAALAVATLMTACIVTPDDHINQSGRQADPGFSRPPAHDHGGLRPGETTHDHPDPGYNYPSDSNNGGLRPGENNQSNQIDPGFNRPTNPDPGYGR